MGFNTNLYKVPHLSTMSYDDIKEFEKNGITPRNPSKIKGGISDGEKQGTQREEDPVG